MPSREPLGVNGFNQLSEQQGMSMLHSVCPSTLLGERLLASRPYVDVDDVLDHADRILTDLPATEVDVILDGHPRIGGHIDNPSSAREQAAMSDAATDVRGQLAAGNRAYEDRFGYVYLVFASGRTADELLTILTGRLDNDPETERQVMLAELAKINRLRLTRVLTDPMPAQS